MAKRASSPRHSRRRATATAVAVAAPGQSLLAGALLITLAIVIVYFPSLRGGFIFDDDLLLTANPLIKDPGGLYRIWFTTDAVDYWPVSNTTLWLEWRLWGLDATGYRVVNLLLHVGDSLLVWAVLRKLSLPGAYLAALLFAVHPVNVESVAWISQRKSLMALLFSLLSILCFVRSGPGAVAAPGGSPWRDRWYWLSVAAFVLAMLSKASAAPVPLLLLAIVWWSRGLAWRDAIWTAPFALIDLLLTAVNIEFARHTAGEVVRTIGPVERLLGAATALWFYLSKALLPLDLVFIYPQWHIHADQIVWWLPLLAAAGLTGVLWFYRQTWGRPLLFAWICFCIALAPAVGFRDTGFMRYAPVADHYQHSALISVVALVAAGLAIWQRRILTAARWQPRAAAVAVTGALALLAWRQSSLYADPIVLYTDTLEKNPEAWMIHTDFAITLQQRGRLNEAIAHYERALQLHPDSPETHVSFANTLQDAGRLQEAVAHCEEALRLQPDLAEAHNNMATALDEMGQIAEAIAHFQEALRVKPGSAEIHNNFANALMHDGQMEPAIEHYHEALRLKPEYPEAYNNLGLALTRTDRFAEALANLRAAVQLNPDFPEARYNLGVALAHEGQREEARRQLEYAVQLRPTYAEAHNDLGVVLVDSGRLDESIAHFERALSLRPTFANAASNLEAARAMKQRGAQPAAGPAIRPAADR